MMHRTLIALSAAALLLGCTMGREGTATSSPSPGTTAGAGGTTSAGGTSTGSSTMDTAGQVSDARLEQYVEIRRQLVSQHPELEQAFQSPDLRGDLPTLEAALSATPMSVEEFQQLHRQVLQNPRLRAQVEARLGTTGTSGAPVVAPSPGWRGAPSSVTPPTTSSGGGTSGAQPSASPQ